MISSGSYQDHTHSQLDDEALRAASSVAASYLLQDRLPLLPVGDRGQLHVSHLLHLLVHVYLLLQLADFGSQQAHGVVPVVLPGQRGGAGRVDRRDPVLQLRLTRGLTGTGGIESHVLFKIQKIELGNVKKGSDGMANQILSSLFNHLLTYSLT